MTKYSDVQKDYMRKGDYEMGKIDLKKKVKENALFQNAFELFTDKGFAKTTISDIVNQAGLAKGTFYLYFKDKYDLRDKLIVHKASQLFTDAHQAVMEAQVDSFEKQLLFITDYIINCFKEQHSLLQFIAKNLSWGVFRNAINNTGENESPPFYIYYLQSMEQNHIVCEKPEIMLFTIIELIGSTCYNCIILEQPVTIDEYLPYLHKSILQIVAGFTEN